MSGNRRLFFLSKYRMYASIAGFILLIEPGLNAQAKSAAKSSKLPVAEESRFKILGDDGSLVIGDKPILTNAKLNKNSFQQNGIWRLTFESAPTPVSVDVEMRDVELCPGNIAFSYLKDDNSTLNVGRRDEQSVQVTIQLSGIFYDVEFEDLSISPAKGTAKNRDTGETVTVSAAYISETTSIGIRPVAGSINGLPKQFESNESKWYFRAPAVSRVSGAWVVHPNSGLSFVCYPLRDVGILKTAYAWMDGSAALYAVIYSNLAYNPEGIALSVSGLKATARQLDDPFVLSFSDGESSADFYTVH